MNRIKLSTFGYALAWCALTGSLGCSSAADDEEGNGGSGGDTASATSGSGGDGGATSNTGGGASSGGAGGAITLDRCDPFAHEVIEVSYGEGAGFGQTSMPGIVLGPPRGAGELQGSLDVVSLGNGGVITLGFGEVLITDGAGPDFIVFENAFYAGGDPDAVFAELGTVSVSADGQTWVSFTCDAVASPFGGCAGVHPVYANDDLNEISPTDAATAGGDAYDLADVGLTEARFVRITDRADLGGFSGVFDLDAIGVVNAICLPERE